MDFKEIDKITKDMTEVITKATKTGIFGLDLDEFKVWYMIYVIRPYYKWLSDNPTLIDRIRHANDLFRKERYLSRYRMACDWVDMKIFSGKLYRPLRYMQYLDNMWTYNEARPYFDFFGIE